LYQVYQLGTETPFSDDRAWGSHQAQGSIYVIGDYNTLNKGTHDLNVKNKLIKGNNSDPVKSRGFGLMWFNVVECGG
jgi:hypothetical protein